jgi:hypothetical protein
MGQPPHQEKVCVACASPIPIGASLCPTCKTWQSPRRRLLQDLAGVVGIIALLGSASVYVVSKLPDVRRTLFWRDDIQVLAFKSEGDLLVANRGDGEVYVSHISLGIRHEGRNRSVTLRLGESIVSGSILKHTFERDSPRIFISAVSDDVWTKVSARATGNRTDPCFSLVFFSRNDPTYLMVSQTYGPKLRTIEATGAVTFWAPRDGRRAE